MSLYGKTGKLELKSFNGLGGQKCVILGPLRILETRGFRKKDKREPRKEKGHLPWARACPVCLWGFWELKSEVGFWV